MIFPIILAAMMIADAGSVRTVPNEPEIALQPKEIIEAEEVMSVVSEPQKMHLYGTCTITFYDNGACCCGQWAGGNTASGAPPTPNHTAASNVLPFGTRILIDGQEYVIEDRGDSGMDAFWIDIYVSTHEEGLRRGMYKSEVWIVDD